MPLALRPNSFASETRSDFDVIERDGGKRIIGRIYSGAGSPSHPMWLYAINGWGSGLADNLPDAKAKFKAQMARLQAS